MGLLLFNISYCVQTGYLTRDKQNFSQRIYGIFQILQKILLMSDSRLWKSGQKIPVQVLYHLCFKYVLQESILQKSDRKVILSSKGLTNRKAFTQKHFAQSYLVIITTCPRAFIYFLSFHSTFIILFPKLIVLLIALQLSMVLGLQKHGYYT